MAKVRLILDTPKSSKSSNSELFPIALRVYHVKPRMIRLPYQTSKIGWNDKEQSLKKSAAINKTLDCDNINRLLYNKLHNAKSLIHEMGDGIQFMGIDVLINEIKTRWQDKISPQLKSKMSNGLMLSD